MSSVVDLASSKPPEPVNQPGILPVLSQDIYRWIRSRCLSSQIPKLPAAFRSLDDRTADLETIQKELKQTEKHEKRLIILGCLETALLTCLVVGAFAFLIATDSIPAAAVLIGAMAVWALVNLYHGYKHQKLMEKDPVFPIKNHRGPEMCLVAFFSFGLLVPAWESITRTERLRICAKNLQTDVDLADPLSEVNQFIKEGKLNRIISHTAERQLGIIGPSRKLNRKAHIELEVIRTYYQSDRTHVTVAFSS